MSKIGIEAEAENADNTLYSLHTQLESMWRQLSWLDTVEKRLLVSKTRNNSVCVCDHYSSKLVSASLVRLNLHSLSPLFSFSCWPIVLWSASFSIVHPTTLVSEDIYLYCTLSSLVFYIAPYQTVSNSFPQQIGKDRFVSISLSIDPPDVTHKKRTVASQVKCWRDLFSIDNNEQK